MIDSLEENVALTALEGMTSAWIGVVNNGGFVDITTNAPPSFSHWAPNDPNGEGNCVRLLETSGDWDDEPCDRALKYLCEIDGRTAVTPIP
ncbi:MAG: C-type lectin domain-containing protein [Myxococcota bacterium]|nr:C-type lectin domain-containing protein [Myxococcota bacterium]